MWFYKLLLRRRRCFENAKPRRSAGGAQLNRFLGELEGRIKDLFEQFREPKVGPASLQIELKSVRVLVM